MFGTPRYIKADPNFLGWAFFMSRYRPSWVLVHLEEVENRSDALKREKL